MNAHFSMPRPIRNGFTLIEVLVSLGLCALLAATTSSAVAFASRAERMALAGGDASLLLLSLYAAQRLHPNTPPEEPHGWNVQRTALVSLRSDGLPAEWHVLEIGAVGHETPPFTLRILNSTP